MTWTATEFQGNSLILSLNYSFPLILAQGKEKDYVHVKVIDDSLLVSKDGMKRLHNDSFEMSKPLKKQLLHDLPSVLLKDGLSSVEGSLDAAGITSLVMNFAFAVGLNRLFGMINALHVICF